MTEPGAHARVDGRGNIIVQAVGSGNNVVVNATSPYLRLTQFEARTERVVGERSDAALLSAYRTDVVPLLGRESELTDLKAWLASGAGISVRVLTGAGGRGKTRLALELVRQASDDGWLAGFVEQNELDRFQAQQNVAEWGWDMPTLVVADYAASRVNQLRDWLGELVDAPSGRLRLLLLERQAQREIGWLPAIFGLGEDDRSRAAVSLLDPPEPMELAAIDDMVSRRLIFAALLARKRPGMGAPEPGRDAEFDRVLRDEKWSGDPLFLMMAGLVAGDIGISNALTLTRTDLAITIARRELVRIGGIAAGAGIDADNRRHPGLLAQHMAVLATLAQGLSLQDARALIADEKSSLCSLADINATVVALRDGLPGGGGTSEIAPILPDIIGEAAILTWLGDTGELSGLGINAESSIHRLARVALGRLSQVLVRVAQDFASTGCDEPVRWLGAIAQIAEADLGALMEIAGKLPDKTMALRELASELAQAIVHRLRLAITDRTTEEATERYQGLLADSLSNLGVRLGYLGRLEEGLVADQEAIDIKRRLAQLRPDDFLPGLATSLNNVGGHLSELGRHKEAFAASQEAVDIRRRLAQAQHARFLPELAMSLSNLGINLTHLDRLEEALAASEEAVDIYRNVAQTQSETFLPELARSLSNLGGHFSELGRREEALVASQEAVDIRRNLAKTRSDAFVPDLADSLANHGKMLFNLGRRGEALVASQEAVDMYRRLAQARPDAFLPNLATSLNNCSAMLSKFGRLDDAVAASKEAVGISRQLARMRPDAFLPDLAASLTNMGGMLFALDHAEKALAASQEAVDIFRGLRRERADAFLADLATSLNNCGAILSELGRQEEALPTIQEAVDMRRSLAQTRPDAFLPDFAASLHVLANVLAVSKRHADAETAARDGLLTIAPFLAQHRHAFRDVARALGRDYLAACEITGSAPNASLLMQVFAADVLEDEIDAILDSVDKADLDDAELAELRSELVNALRADDLSDNSKTRG